MNFKHMTIVLSRTNLNMKVIYVHMVFSKPSPQFNRFEKASGVLPRSEVEFAFPCKHNKGFDQTPSSNQIGANFQTGFSFSCKQ